MMRRRGGPGILSTMARTAVIAGTATAVSNKVSAAGAAKAQAAQQQQAAAHAAQQELAQVEDSHTARALRERAKGRGKASRSRESRSATVLRRQGAAANRAR